MQRASRLKRELHMLATEPPPGITCWQEKDQMDDLRAQILGGSNTPYEKGVFKLEVMVPERYPFEPPQIRFLTPIYHPNIDSAGRICLDVLKLPPKGAWRPSLNIATALTSIQLLMAEPNPDDPLMADIVSVPLSLQRLSYRLGWLGQLGLRELLTAARLFSIGSFLGSQSSEFKYNRPAFLRNARLWTEKHARQKQMVEAEEVPDALAEAADSEAHSSTQKRKATQLGGTEKKFHFDV